MNTVDAFAWKKKNAKQFLLTASLLLSLSTNVWAADVLSQQSAQSLSSPLGSFQTTPPSTEKFDLRQHLVQHSHYQKSEVEVEIGLHLISVNVLNSRSNAITRQQREEDATLLASMIEKVIKADHQFSDINAIHINYAKRTRKSSKLIQGFDFFQTKAGAFILNKS